jgi:ribosomal protein S12 methylthiotransferase accessory factor
MGAVPITRLADLTPLDRLGLPVWSATTPLARDLTTHLGKGADAVAARVSALMEAVERASAERVSLPLLRVSWRELDGSGVAALDPRLCDLPHDSAFAPDAVLGWIEADCLVGNRKLQLPLDLAVSPPGEGVLRHVDTNGLAAGNSRLEAIVHALAEVIERDAVSQHLFAELYLEASDSLPQRLRIAPLTLPEPAGAIVETARGAGIDVVVDWLVTDIAVATFRALMIDHAYPTPDGPATRCFVGYGTAPDAMLAVMRALTEAVQSRLAVIQGARDAFNRTPAADDAARPFAWLADFTAQQLLPFDAVPTFESTDLAADLDFLLRQLARVGLDRVIVADLTRPDLDIPVVRVRVPGLACFAVNQQRVGWRCRRHLL